MNKKGFTLIELLGVVTIIALLSLIILPNISSNIKKKKVEISEVSMNLLSGAADTYIENNSKKYAYTFDADGSTYCIPLQTLIDSGNLESPFRDINGREVDYSNVVKAIYTPAYNGFSYEIVSSNSCSEVVNYVSRPQLADGMIPVYYDTTDDVWKKSNVSSQWYSYSDKRWANAVIVKKDKDGVDSKSREEYKDALPGTIIDEDDILAYFVWIPRFRYQLFSSNTPEDINVIFEDISTPKSQGTAPGQWLTHPAFSFNGKELPGVWVGKYNPSDSNGNIIIKSFESTLVNVDYVEANKKVISMVNEGNVYGLKDVNTHVIRNSEWGALTYLTNSIYGNYLNDSTTGNDTGVFELTNKKQFVIMDNENENSFGYALGETTNWVNGNTYPDGDNLYLTRGNSSIFSYNKSKVVDSNTSFRVAMTNTDIQNQEYKQKYIVTFDPNGGTVDTTSKEVSYHEAYGELPVPTRSGYTFKGWNGKNLLNYNELSSEARRVGLSVDVNGLISDSTPTSDSRAWNYQSSNFYSSLQAGEYIFSIEFLTKSTSEQYAQMLIFSDSNSWITNKISVFDILKIESSWSSNQVRNIGIMIKAYDGIYRVQLEEGNTVTEFEPYYVTSDTMVVQDKNHTLKAIWEANS